MATAAELIRLSNTSVLSDGGTLRVTVNENNLGAFNRAVGELQTTWMPQHPNFFCTSKGQNDFGENIYEISGYPKSFEREFQRTITTEAQQKEIAGLLRNATSTEYQDTFTYAHGDATKWGANPIETYAPDAVKHHNYIARKIGELDTVFKTGDFDDLISYIKDNFPEHEIPSDMGQTGQLNHIRDNVLKTLNQEKEQVSETVTSIPRFRVEYPAGYKPSGDRDLETVLQETAGVLGVHLEYVENSSSRVSAVFTSVKPQKLLENPSMEVPDISDQIKEAITVKQQELVQSEELAQQETIAYKAGHAIGSLVGKIQSTVMGAFTDRGQSHDQSVGM